MSLKTDEQLVADIKEGDIPAFETLVKRYQKKLFSFVNHIVYNEKDAEEAVQDAFLSVYKTIDRIDTTRKFSSLLFTIARNSAISTLRKQKKEVSLEEISVIDEDEDIYEKIQNADQKTLIQKAINKLSPSQKQTIRLYYFADLSYEEIGKKLKLPVNTVRTHLRRGKEALKKLLESPTGKGDASEGFPNEASREAA